MEERNVDPSQLSTANVEFIHPKLKENMQDDEDPENPFVWLNSYSRVPVSFNEFLKIGLFICSTTYNLYLTSKNETKNSRIHNFTNLKCCKMSFKVFKMKKARLKMVSKLIDKK